MAELLVFETHPGNPVVLHSLGSMEPIDHYTGQAPLQLGQIECVILGFRSKRRGSRGGH